MDQTTFWYTPNDIGQSIREGSQGKAQQRNDHWFNWQWDNTLTYDKRIGEDHNFSVLAGFSLQKNDWNYNQIDAMGFANNLRGYKNLGAAFLKDKFNLASDFTTNTLVSYLGRINYSYKDRYFATVTTRFDASSRFTSNHRNGTFPSVALGWNLAEESFMQDLNLDLLKIRAGYGIAGNQNIPNQAYQTLYSSAYTNNSVTYNVYDNRQGNPNLRWERQKQLNIGLDFGILNDRVTFSADYFHIENSGLLMKQTLSATSGFGYTINNVGTMTNRGVEFAVNARVLDINDFRWSISANLSSARNKVTRLYGDVNAIYNKGGFTGVEIQREGNYFVGQSVNSIYVMKFDKIAQQSDMDYVSTLDLGGRTIRPGDIMPKDINGDHVIDVNDRVVVGRKDPKFYGGFTTDFSWKNFSLNAIFTYNYGSKRINYLYEGMMSGSGITTAHEDELDRWTPDHTSTNVPRAFFGGSRFGVGDTDWSVQNASFLRLSTLTLAYTMPEAAVSKLGMHNLRIYVTGSNVFLVTKYKGYDPETGDDFPNNRMIVTGVNFSF
jgi:TonB-linked SusC/RagA family outer membrane protein